LLSLEARPAQAERYGSYAAATPIALDPRYWFCE